MQNMDGPSVEHQADEGAGGGEVEDFADALFGEEDAAQHFDVDIEVGATAGIGDPLATAVLEDEGAGIGRKQLVAHFYGLCDLRVGGGNPGQDGLDVENPRHAAAA